MNKPNLFILSSNNEYIKLLRQDIRKNLSKSIAIGPWSNKLPPNVDNFLSFTEDFIKNIDLTEEKYVCLTENFIEKNDLFKDIIEYGKSDKQQKNKFIVILDDPIINLINEAAGMGNDINYHMQTNFQSLFEKRNYPEILKKIYSDINLFNIKIVIGENLVTNYLNEMQEICKFLNINHDIIEPKNIDSFKNTIYTKNDIINNNIIDSNLFKALIQLFTGINNNSEKKINDMNNLKDMINSKINKDVKNEKIVLPWISEKDENMIKKVAAPVPAPVAKPVPVSTPAPAPVAKPVSAPAPVAKPAKPEDVSLNEGEVNKSLFKNRMAWVPTKAIPVIRKKTINNEEKLEEVNIRPKMAWNNTKVIPPQEDNINIENEKIKKNVIVRRKLKNTMAW